MEHQVKCHGFYGIYQVNLNKTNARNQLYTCNHNGCNKSFFELKRLNEHQKTHKRPIKCTFDQHCKKTFARKLELQIHIKTKHLINDNSFEKCKFCDRKFSSLNNLRTHIKCVHDACVNPFVCRKCHKQFNRKSSLQSHWKTHKNKDKLEKFSCKQCESTFTFKYNLNKHMRNYH